MSLDVEYDPNYSIPHNRASPRWEHLSPQSKEISTIIMESGSAGGNFWESEDLVQRTSSVPRLGRMRKSMSGASSPRSPRSRSHTPFSRSRRSSHCDTDGDGSRSSSTSPDESLLSPYSPHTPLPPHGGYRLYRRRFGVLILFSLLSFLNRMICFTYAPVAEKAKKYYHAPIHLSWLVDSFFIVYAVIALPSARIVDRFGLRASVIVSAWIQCIGASLRMLTVQKHESEAFYLVFLGQLVAACAQGVFLNAPPLLSALWFAEDERTMATTVSVLANTCGIAGAYLVSPIVASHHNGIVTLNQFVALVCFVFAVATSWFPEEPPYPPTRSVHIKEALPKVENWATLKELISKRGYLHCVLLFAAGEGVLNTISTYIVDMLHVTNLDSKSVGYIGVLFISIGIVSSVIVGRAVDRTKMFKPFGILCCGLMTVSMCLFSIFSSANGDHSAIWILILSVGFWVAPLEPIAVELAAECTYPCSENTFTALMQISGNVLAGAMIPLVLALPGVNSANWMVFGVSLVTLLVFVTFNGRSARTEREGKKLLDDTSASEYGTRESLPPLAKLQVNEHEDDLSVSCVDSDIDTGDVDELVVGVDVQVTGHDDDFDDDNALVHEFGGVPNGDAPQGIQPPTIHSNGNNDASMNDIRVAAGNDDCVMNDDNVDDENGGNDGHVIDDVPANNDGNGDNDGHVIDDVPANNDGNGDNDGLVIDNAPANSDGNGDNDGHVIDDLPANNDGSGDNDGLMIDNAPANNNGSGGNDDRVIRDAPANSIVE